MTPADPKELLKGTMPGPWTYVADGACVVTGEPEPRDLVYFDDLCGEATLSDLRLIAAAPDLARRLAVELAFHKEAEALIRDTLGLYDRCSDDPMDFHSHFNTELKDRAESLLSPSSRTKSDPPSDAEGA